MPTQASPMTVLMVDDNHTDIQLAGIMLDGLETPVDMHYAYSVVDGLAFLRRQPPYENAPRPDFVLLDLNMPGADGFDMLAMLRADPALKSTTVIILTTSDRPSEFERATALGANMILTKPIDLDDYQELLRGIERSWRDSRALSPSR